MASPFSGGGVVEVVDGAGVVLPGVIGEETPLIELLAIGVGDEL